MIKITEHQGFHTLRGYTLQNGENQGLTPSMEDYLEMIFRLSHGKNPIRINDLAAALNVRPPSATRMARRLAEAGYLKYERYGTIELTSSGKEQGTRLFERHLSLEQFFRILGVKDNLLKDTEKIEHSLSHETLNCICLFVEFAQHHPEILEYFYAFCKIYNP